MNSNAICVIHELNCMNYVSENNLVQTLLCQIRPTPYECPSENVIVQRYRCHDKETKSWKDCYRRSCCKGYTLMAGRCLQADQDPCSLDLCEQKCSVFFGRVICTCFGGYKFHPENQKNGIRPYCIGTLAKEFVTIRAFFIVNCSLIGRQ